MAPIYTGSSQAICSMHPGILCHGGSSFWLEFCLVWLQGKLLPLKPMDQTLGLFFKIWETFKGRSLSPGLFFAEKCDVTLHPRVSFWAFSLLADAAEMQAPGSKGAGKGMGFGKGWWGPACARPVLEKASLFFFLFWFPQMFYLVHFVSNAPIELTFTLFFQNKCKHTRIHSNALHSLVILALHILHLICVACWTSSLLCIW